MRVPGAGEPATPLAAVGESCAGRRAGRSCLLGRSSEKMIMHLPGPVASPCREEGRGFNRASRFCIHVPPRRKQRSARGQQPFPWVVSKRWIEKDHVEQPAFVCEECARVDDVQLERFRAEHRLCGSDRGDRRATPIYGDRERSAPRRGLERKHAGAGVEIETSPSSEILAEPIEKRFADAVRRGAQPVGIGETDSAAAPGATGDANAVCRIRRQARSDGLFGQRRALSPRSKAG